MKSRSQRCRMFLALLLALGCLWALWSWSRPAPLLVIDCGARLAGFSPDSKMLATQPVQRETVTGPIRLWSTSTGAEVGSFLGTKDLIWFVRFGEDGTLLVARCDEDKRVKFVDPVAGKECVSLIGHNGCVSPDFQKIAFATLPDLQKKNANPAGRSYSDDLLAQARSTVKLWNRTTGREMGACGKGVPWTFSPDGRTLVTERLLSESDEQELSLWDVAKIHRRGGLRVPFSSHGIRFSPDGQTLAIDHSSSRTGPGCVKLVDVATVQERATLIGAFDMSFVRDGKVLATFYPDPVDTYCVKYWDAVTGTELETFRINPTKREMH